MASTGPKPRGRPAPDPERADTAHRLSERILAAFTHAYGAGEAEIATRLHDVLALNERRNHNRGYGAFDALGQAALWVAFVDARDTYKTVSNAGNEDGQAVAEAAAVMKEAYLRWSSG